MANTVCFHAVGRRKKAIARVRLIPGEGNIVINKRSLDEYFGLETLKTVVRQPLTLTETGSRFDVLVNVRGGGYTGQAGAIRHGIARSLVKADPELKDAIFVSPFSYANATGIFAKTADNATALIFGVGIMMVSAAAAGVIYCRRDLAS